MIRSLIEKKSQNRKKQFSQSQIIISSSYHQYQHVNFCYCCSKTSYPQEVENATFKCVIMWTIASFWLKMCYPFLAHFFVYRTEGDPV